ncbi:hypothetical protein [Streptomyces liangshanensis]|uniref:Uncharacterized protein n=1 Tax=Streptomyces liangshanensis TaxID=2717324 RepID=A0A6G9GXG1_9ACTN|nr:hypothetical protein [Streptomyces liangshanensis]QIQ02958.1 hypothetical protein HA039_12020 [Streptomyces liangshanensis]
MICPNCQENVLYKERPSYTCSKCRRTFALEPRANSLRLHDARFLRVAAKLTDNGRMKITESQFWFVLSRKTLNSVRGPRSGVPTAIGCLAFGLPVGAGLCFTGVAVGGGAYFLVVLGALLVLAAVGGAVGNVQDGRKRYDTLPLSPFREQAMARWKFAYGSLPPGIVDDATLRRTPRPERPRAALLCADLAVASFLAANDLPARYGVEISTTVQALPDGVPVVVLHDAGAIGSVQVLAARDALPGRRVVDAGLRPRVVMKAKGAVVPHGTAPSAADVRRLRAAGTLTAEELTWLADGWWSPLVGAPPVKLLNAVSTVLERVTGSADANDPDRRRAETLGFLTWPDAGTA